VATVSVTVEAEQAIAEWYRSGEAEIWNATVGDGLNADDALSA
jgi:hypothetical protein